MIVFLALWLFGQAISVLLVWHFVWRVGRPASAPAMPRVAVVVAVKGHDIEFDGFLDRVLAQDYPAYRVIFGVEAADDEAVRAIEARGEAAPGRVMLVVAGLADNESQKITNLRATLPHLTPDDEILVFADADIWPQPDWLQRVVEPIVRGETDAVSAYPWLVPYDRRFSTLLLTAVSAGVATVPRAPMWDSAWGGVMGISHARFSELGIGEAWRGAISEDFQLTKKVQEGKGGVLAPCDLLLRTPIVTDGLAHIAHQARRWYMLVRVHAPLTYGIALAVTSFNAAGWLLAGYAALIGSAQGVPILLAAVGLAILRTGARAALVSRLWGRSGLRENGWFLCFDWLLAPLAAVFSAGVAWSAMFLRRMTWGGTTYEVIGPQDVRIIARPGGPTET
jgi:cellulose synthase/poly-beta-1,6-N-acetylglucosamine synthase-like glycosyltransferase